MKWSNWLPLSNKCFRTVTLLNVPPIDVYLYRMRYVQVCTQCKNCNIFKKFENSLNQWKAVKGEVRNWPQPKMRFLWNMQNLQKIWKFAKFENPLNIVQQWKRRLRGPELNLWFLWDLRKLGKHETDNFKVAPLASVWLPAKCEAIDMKMFFYYSQYAKIFIFTNSVLHVALFWKRHILKLANGLFSVPCEQRFLSFMAF